MCCRQSPSICSQIFKNGIKMGYRKDGNITNIPLYLVGKTKELLEGERDLE